MTPALAERPLPIGECNGLGEDPLRDLDALRALHALHVAVQRHRPARDLAAGRLRRRRPARPACRSSASRSTRTAAAGRRADGSRAPVGAPAPRHYRTSAIRRGLTPSASASVVPRAVSISTASICASSQVSSEVGAGERLLGPQRGAQAGQRERERAPAAARRRRARAGRPRAGSASPARPARSGRGRRRRAVERGEQAVGGVLGPQRLRAGDPAARPAAPRAGSRAAPASAGGGRRARRSGSGRASWSGCGDSRDRRAASAFARCIRIG